MFICLHGLTNHVLHEIIKNEKYQSPFHCIEHEHCCAVMCAWPYKKIELDWRGHKTSLLKEATTCNICTNPGEFLCVYGGHMLCKDHIFKVNKKFPGRFQSPFTCCCEKSKYTGPVWPNPFQAYFINDDWTVLKNNEQSLLASYQNSILQISHKNEFNIILKKWLYAGDKFPTTEIISSMIKSKTIHAWKIAFFQTEKKDQLTLKKCHHFWKQTNFSSCLQMISSRYKERSTDYIIFSSSATFFMFIFIPQKKLVQCMNCRRYYQPAEFFISECNILEDIDQLYTMTTPSSDQMFKSHITS